MKTLLIVLLKIELTPIWHMDTHRCNARFFSEDINFENLFFIYLIKEKSLIPPPLVDSRLNFGRFKF